MATIGSVLIANRGEIAVRVIRTVKALGLRALAVHSQADTLAPHVVLADDAALIGPAPVGESYLSAERILAAARRLGADAIHPGYGFLSENAGFAAACAEAGIIFIGPSPEAIDVMGNKAGAKRRMIEAGVPCVPGYEGADQSDATLLAEGRRIGTPLMVKAAAGGGGRGMRLVTDLTGLQDALGLARSEAQNAFGSGELILEKAIQQPRHVEIQVFGDAHGTVVHLGERDCSIQRRHQKVIEEAPSPAVGPELRAAMGAAAVRAAEAIGYQGAGTVEFLLDGEGRFYFLEMNTRLQVEHPVTECITGLDLVALQIAVAEGKPLGFTQEDVELRGHAMEARLYTEDPAKDFLPATGLAEVWQAPEGDGVRVDAGIASGQDISPFYDPMVAKIIAFGPNREVARRRLAGALERTVLVGPRNNRAFLIACLDRPRFIDGEATTAFIGEEFAAADLAGPPVTVEHAAAAAALHHHRRCAQALEKAVSVSPGLAGWTSADAVYTRYQYTADTGETFDLSVTAHGANDFHVTEGGRTLQVQILRGEGSWARLTLDGARRDIHVHVIDEGRIAIQDGALSVRFENRVGLAATAEDQGGGGTVSAPMHGKIVGLFVATGRAVQVGDRLAVLEAMKMQHEILADVDGTVEEVFTEEGAQVAAEDVLIRIAVAEG